MTDKSARKQLDLLSFPKKSQVDSNSPTQPPVVREIVEPPTPNKNRSKVKGSASRPQTNSSTRNHTRTSQPRLQVVKNSSTSTTKKNHKSASASTSNSFKLIYSPLLTFFRLVTMVVGGAAIIGTILAAVDQNHQFKANQSDDPNVPSELTASNSSVQSISLDNTSVGGEEIPGVIPKLEQIINQYTHLEPGVFLLDLDNNGYANLSGSKTFAAASTIKIPILVALLEAVDADTVYLDEQLVMEPELIVGGSGDMQYQPPGKQYSVLETAEKMIVISDNTATNMIIERLGGQEVVNERFREWGLHATTINNPLPDLEGTNTTSPEDLVTLLQKIERGELLSRRSRDRLLAIMGQTKTRSLLPQGLEPDATIAHKTGDIGTMLGDAGIVDMPTGKRYIAAVLVNRPHNDPQGKKLIQEISRTAYQHFKWYKPRDSFTEDE